MPNDFNLDDNAIIKENPLIRSLSNLPKIFVSNYWANTPYEKGVLLYRPLVIASFAFDYAVWALNPLGYHLANVLLNTINAVLAFWLLTLLFGPNLTPLKLTIAALLFALHPTHTEAINMVVGRTEILAALFGMLTFGSHLKRQKWLAFGSFFLALLCKESAVTIPIMIFLYEYLFKPAPARAAKKIYLFFGAILAVYLAIRFAVLGGFVAVQQTGILDRLTPAERAFTVIKVVGYYLNLLLVPYPLTPDYSDVPLPRSLLDIWVFLPAAAIAVLVWVAFKLRTSWPGISFAIAWFFVTLLPVSNIISIGALVGDRFLYLPSFSAALIGAALFYYLPAKTYQPVLLAGSALVVVIFGSLSVARNFVWKNAHTLWTNVLTHQPDNPRANFHVAEKFATAQDYERAVPLYEKAIKLYPDHNWNPDSKTVAIVKDRLSGIYYHLGLTVYKQNKFQEAIEYCRKAIAYNDKNAAAYVVVGNSYVQQGDFRQGAQFYEAALKVDPNQFEAKENLKRIQQFK